MSIPRESLFQHPASAARRAALPKRRSQQASEVWRPQRGTEIRIGSGRLRATRGGVRRDGHWTDVATVRRLQTDGSLQLNSRIAVGETGRCMGQRPVVCSYGTCAPLTVAVLETPPLTVELASNAEFNAPPLTELQEPPAKLTWPPLIEAARPRAMLDSRMVAAFDGCSRSTAQTNSRNCNGSG
jgi:hypothetical protein